MGEVIQGPWGQELPGEMFTASELGRLRDYGIEISEDPDGQPFALVRTCGGGEELFGLYVGGLGEVEIVQAVDLLRPLFAAGTPTFLPMLAPRGASL